MKTIMEMAREVKANLSATEDFVGWNFTNEHLEAFAKLVRADERNRTWTQEHWTEYERNIAATEREACAKVCDDSVEYAGSELARQIRARSQTPCVHEWVDDTKLKPQWRCAKCGIEYTKEKNT